MKPGKLKAYLGGIARNKAKEKLRSACMEISLEDDLLVYNGAALSRSWRLVRRPALSAAPCLPCSSRTGRYSCATITITNRYPS